MSKARHPKAASLVRQTLFAGVTSFTELEHRIAALPDEQARGDAFEVFAEAYLATQRKHDAAAVWLQSRRTYSERSDSRPKTTAWMACSNRFSDTSTPTK
jgi:uncharacterized small protein (DUF1192 family)